MSNKDNLAKGAPAPPTPDFNVGRLREGAPAPKTPANIGPVPTTSAPMSATPPISATSKK